MSTADARVSHNLAEVMLAIAHGTPNPVALARAVLGMDELAPEPADDTAQVVGEGGD